MESPHSYSSGKRKRSRSPPSQPYKQNSTSRQSRNGRPTEIRERTRSRPWNEQARLNQIQEDERMREWVAQEDDFVLKQAKKKAAIRVRDARARPIDWLAVLLRVIDPTRDLLDTEIDDEELEFVDPEGVFDGLNESSLSELGEDIQTYMKLEKSRRNQEYWQTMSTICKDRRKRLRSDNPESRTVGSVSSDVDALLRPKSYGELETLEKQIQQKLSSDEPIDTDYWQQLLDSLLVWKARAKLKLLCQDVLNSRLAKLRSQNAKEAETAKTEFVTGLGNLTAHPPAPSYSKALDPDPLLQLPSKDRSTEILDETEYLQSLSRERRKIMQLGYVPANRARSYQTSNGPSKLILEDSEASQISKPITGTEEGFSQTAKTMYDREAARGVGENEEVFAGEEEVETRNKDLWVGKYRPRKPKYFNRVQMGYEWNKYNQTHYDHDNPPPKVVQGYKFHIFYPDLIDKSKAPTYKIIREGGRKKGQSSAPAGEEDTCIIRFDSGPPYESIAFKIVDRDWDYSAKHDRGFKSTFENGILTLHFSFKKIYYRK